jgi:uncharacterized membrane protein YphA (DoxX/SURF4 family)
MSWFEQLAGDTVAEHPSGPLWLFRTIFATAVLVKCASETKRGFTHAYQPTTWLYFLLRVRHIERRERLPGKRVYLLGYALRVLATCCLLLGYLPHLAAAVLCAVLLAECQVYFRFHTNYFTLLSACLVFAPRIPTLLGGLSHMSTGPNGVWDAVQAERGPATCALLIAMTTSALYFGSAYRKLSKVFLDGTVVWSTLDFIGRQQPLRRHFDGWYPGWLGTALDCVRPGHPLWRVAMGSVVLLEATLPVLLVFPQTRALGIGLGLGMHLGFMVLFPVTLLPFSLVTTAAYPTFPVFAV